jgi:MFS family permease
MFGLVLAINTVLIVFFDVPVNTATARWPHGRTLFLGCALVGAGYGALAFSRSVAAVSATVVVWTVGEIFMLGALNAVASDLAPAARRGEYMGLFQVAFSGAFLVGPGAGIFVLERLGPAALWGGCFAVALLSGVLLARVSTSAAADPA